VGFSLGLVRFSLGLGLIKKIFSNEKNKNSNSEKTNFSWKKQ
jgi:hypothetical protein